MDGKENDREMLRSVTIFETMFPSIPISILDNTICNGKLCVNGQKGVGLRRSGEYYGVLRFGVGGLPGIMHADMIVNARRAGCCLIAIASHSQ